jgi:EAL domain-containing protein (putative c-di-GMP-specific phosphodiesterase class I)
MDGGDILSGQARCMISSLPGWKNPRERFAKAFAEHEFLLYSQSVEKLNSGSDERPHTEIYVRLREEEQNVVPPGTFLPMLEHYKLGSKLDLYVLRRALAWHFGNRQLVGFMLHINLCQGTLVDLEFPSIVVTELKAAGCGADSLCFEIPDVDGPPVIPLHLSSRIGSRRQVAT